MCDINFCKNYRCVHAKLGYDEIQVFCKENGRKIGNYR